MALVLAGLLMSLLVYFNLSKTGADIRDQSGSDLKETLIFSHGVKAKNMSDFIFWNLESLKNQLERISFSSKFDVRKGKEKDNHFYNAIGGLSFEKNHLDEIQYINEKGEILFSFCDPELASNEDFSSLKIEDLFTDKNQELFISELFYTENSNIPYQYFAQKINTQRNKDRAFLLAKQDLSFLLDSISSKGSKANSKVFITNQKNELILASNSLIEFPNLKTIPGSVKSKLKNDFEGEEWQDDLIAIYKNAYNWKTTFLSPNKLAQLPIEEKIGNLDQQFDSTIFKILFYSVLFILGMIALFTYIGVKVAREITNPISSLIKATRKVTNGDLSISVPIKNDDEMGELTQSFNTMTYSLKDFRQKLEERHKHVENQALLLSASNKELDQYAHTVSHDIKQPLRMVSSYIQLLEHKYGEFLKGDAEEYLQYCKDGTKSMFRIVDDLLKFATFNQKSRKQTKKAIDLNVIINEVLDNLRLRIDETNAEIEVSYLPIVNSKHTHMVQLFQNLIENAIKYKNENTVPKIKIEVSEEENKHIFSISDNGLGISKDQQRKIFDEFHRGSTFEDREGLGIGLATVKKIILINGGKISLESTEGKGSTFYFSLNKIPLLVAKKKVANVSLINFD